MIDTLHATAVSVNDRAVVLRGRSGSGKSSTALAMLQMGAVLIADDQVRMTREDAHLFAHAPEVLPGHIETRGVGILHAAYQDRAEVALIVDLDHVEKDRLPPVRSCSILGVTLPLLWRVDAPYFPAAIVQFLNFGRANL